MSINPFDGIREAEAQAQALVLDAQNSANEVVKNAESQATETERQAAVAHRALYQQLLQQRREQVEGSLEGLAEQARADMEVQVKLAEGRVPEAVAYLVNEVLDGHS
ncbi:MAG: hypothetical protein GXY84_08490 [Clostridiales bacterium]|nr:hypothetical protein [Clostridiales bacterium]